MATERWTAGKVDLVDATSQASGHVAFPVPSGSITTLREEGYFHNRAVVAVGDTADLRR